MTHSRSAPIAGLMVCETGTSRLGATPASAISSGTSSHTCPASIRATAAVPGDLEAPRNRRSDPMAGDSAITVATPTEPGRKAVDTSVRYDGVAGRSGTRRVADSAHETRPPSRSPDEAPRNAASRPEGQAEDGPPRARRGRASGCAATAHKGRRGCSIAAPHHHTSTMPPRPSGSRRSPPCSACG